MDLELNASRGELLGLSLFLNSGPETVQAIGHLVDDFLLLFKTVLDFLLRLDQEVNLFLGDVLVNSGTVLLSSQLLCDELETLHVEWDHAQGDSCLIILELFLKLDGQFVFSLKVVPAIE